MNTTSKVAIALLATVSCVAAMPKYEGNEGKTVVEEKSDPNSVRPARFGFPTYTPDIQTGVVPGVYGPVKLDIGGLLLGTIVGLGAFFILPKLLHVGSPYGGYKRSEDEHNSLDELFAKVHESLSAYKNETTECLQRAICYSARSADDNDNTGTVHNFTNTLVKHNVTKSLIDGTEWKKAVDVGESGSDCVTAYPNCPLTLDRMATDLVSYFIS